MQDVGVLWNMLGLLRHVCDENWKRLDQRSFYLSLICRGLGCAHLVLDVGMEAGGKVPECRQLMSLYAIQDVGHSQVCATHKPMDEFMFYSFSYIIDP